MKTKKGINNRGKIGGGYLCHWEINLWFTKNFII